MSEHPSSVSTAQSSSHVSSVVCREFGVVEDAKMMCNDMVCAFVEGARTTCRLLRYEVEAFVVGRDAGQWLHCCSYAGCGVKQVTRTAITIDPFRCYPVLHFFCSLSSSPPDFSFESSSSQHGLWFFSAFFLAFSVFFHLFLLLSPPSSLSLWPFFFTSGLEF